MPSMRDLRRRIKSVKNTSQITKAMQMVSATKMRKAQNQTLQARPYTQTLSEVFASVSGKVNASTHQLLNKNASGKTGILVLSTDKGLCGALNTNIFRLLQGLTFSDVVFYTVGKKGRDFTVRTGKNLEADFENHEHISFHQAIKIRNFLVNLFLTAEIGEVYLLYPHFISTLRQESRLLKILPVENLLSNDTSQNQSPAEKSEFLFEPNTDTVLDFALTHFIDTQIYQALLETKASEHSARMMAMQNATDNAKDLVSDLQLTYNQARQDAITKELLEITTAGAALE